MAVADAPSALPLTPETCDHPAPVTGVMAHEFAHYEGAVGPEGLRRTVTYYGPIVGGLPIQAWHCEQCGLLRLSYPDGRTEERRLFPGPQPGLLASASPVATERVHYGMQARVSGLSGQPAFIDQLTGGAPTMRTFTLPTITLPVWDAITWLTVLGMAAVVLGLLLAGLFATLSYSTPSVELPLVLSIVGIFVGILLLRLIVLAIRHFAPAEPLTPSLAVLMRGKPELELADQDRRLSARSLRHRAVLHGGARDVHVLDARRAAPGTGHQPCQCNRRDCDQARRRHRTSLQRQVGSSPGSMPLKAPPDQDIVIVGATGDLAQRKLIPALYNLQAQKLLPAGCDIIGAAPFDWNDQRFRDLAESSVKQFSRTPLQKTAFNAFASRLRFVPLSADGDLSAVRKAATRDRRLAYLAVPPSAFTSLIDGIKTAGLADGTSIIIEKPFGHDLKSAEALNNTLHDVVPEQQIFRIDHYMGKETVQNLLIFRFGNSLFERIWSRDAIARVEITVAESLGVEQRGKLYEEIGAIRDIVQNHMFQVLALVAMDPPLSFDAEAIRNEKVKVLQSIQPIHPHDVVRGQYTAGTIEGEPVAAYRDEPGVAPTSTTETYAALRLHLESWRWSGVPFLLRTGKRLPKRDTRVVITFHDVPLHLFKTAGVHTLHRNRLVVRIQPDEGIALSFVAKQPGPEVTAQSVDMNFNYGNSFKTSPPEAYERLLHDALEGDHTLFIREDEVEHGWKAVEPVIEAPPPITFYPAGSWGPDDAARIASPSQWDDSVDAV